VHWLGVRPESSHLTLTDFQWQTNAKLRIWENVSDTKKCDDYEAHVPDYHHHMNCARCLGPTVKARHNRVLAVLRKILHDHGIFSSTLQDLNSKTDKDVGPDAVIYSSTTRAIDIHVNYQGPLSDNYRTRVAEAVKMNKYAQWANVSGWPIHSVGFSHLGVACENVTTLLRTLSFSATCSQGMIMRALCATTIAVARGNADMIKYQEIAADTTLYGSPPPPAR